MSNSIPEDICLLTFKNIYYRFPTGSGHDPLDDAGSTCWATSLARWAQPRLTISAHGPGIGANNVGLWWLMMDYDGLWWIMMDYECLWMFMNHEPLKMWGTPGWLLVWHILLGYLRCSWHLLSAGMFFVEDIIVGYRWPEVVVTFWYILHYFNCIISHSNLDLTHNAESDMPNLTCIQSQSELPSERNLLDLQSLSSTTSRVLSPDGRWRTLEAGIQKYSEVISVCDYVDFHSWYLLAWKFEFRSFGGQVLGTGQHISWESELQA